MADPVPLEDVAEAALVAEDNPDEAPEHVRARMRAREVPTSLTAYPMREARHLPRAAIARRHTTTVRPCEQREHAFNKSSGKQQQRLPQQHLQRTRKIDITYDDAARSMGDYWYVSSGYDQS